ncbi:class I SAM-dependent methyltransferase [Runella sp.]|uniref:class I SAM-dependent methyltransferase n=1 Tax=Runella sp. TaxID=1960881 RepID=UPI003D0B925D
METHNGCDFYDQQGIFENYVKYRTWKVIPNESIEKPIILSLLNTDVKGAVLDLGCGYGDLAKELLARGATNYTGVDSSRKMITFGQAVVKDERAVLIQADINQWDYPIAAYDLVISCSVFHYIDDLDALLTKVSQSLKPGGELILSVEHPLVTFFKESESIVSYSEYSYKRLWDSNDYFNEGSRVHAWMQGNVVKFHRPIETYWRVITEAGFRIECLKEGRPEEGSLSTLKGLKSGLIIQGPQFLIIRAVKV